MKASKKNAPAKAPEETPPAAEAGRALEPGPVRGFDGRHMVIGKDNTIREGRMETIKI
jgi:hypothetical protein